MTAHSALRIPTLRLELPSSKDKPRHKIPAGSASDPSLAFVVSRLAGGSRSNPKFMTPDLKLSALNPGRNLSLGVAAPIQSDERGLDDRSSACSDEGGGQGRGLLPQSTGCQWRVLALGERGADAARGPSEPRGALADHAAVRRDSSCTPPLAHLKALLQMRNRLPLRGGRHHYWDDLPRPPAST